MRWLAGAWMAIAWLVGPAVAHDIPNARVDRSIQATLEPGRLRIAYQLGISELSLTQDLRQIGGEVSGVDRKAWFEEFGRMVGPLIARGILVTVNGEEVELNAIGFELTIEGHPLYTFYSEAKVPPRGRLEVNDTNYLSSEGTSRLAIQPEGAVQVAGDDLPTDVTQIPIRPVWQLDKLEERRTRRVKIDYGPSAIAEPIKRPVVATTPIPRSKSEDSLSWLLDRNAPRAWPILWLVAFALGAVHAIQPGHGKTIVLASTLGSGLGSGAIRGVLLGLLTALVHMTSVTLIAGALWATRAVRPENVHLVLAHSTGFLLAAIGFWKIGRHLAGLGEHDLDAHDSLARARGIMPLALAGGAVPCWDAVGLVLVAEAIGRLGLGLSLLAAFSLGMATVLMGVGFAASRFRARFGGSERRPAWERRLGIAGGMILAAIGLSLLATG